MTQNEFLELKKDVTRALSVNAIQNMMSTTSYMFAIGEYSTIYHQFFSKREDITAEVADRKAVGPQGVYDLLVATWETYAQTNRKRMKAYYPADPDVEGRNGLLDLRAMASPIIEIAGDAETAKGLWMMPGTQTFMANGAVRPTAHWVWTKLAADFVNEDGKWRIWHFVITPCFAAPYDTSWVDAGNGTIYAQNPYSLHGTYPHPPRPPKPYSTFEETFSY